MQELSTIYVTMARFPHISAQLTHLTMSSVDNPTRHKSQSFRFSIRSILVITAVFAAAALGVGHLYRAANGDVTEIGPFVVTTAMVPTVLMVFISWCFRLTRWLNTLLRD